MKISTANSDPAVLKELGRRLARYRLNKNLTQEALSNEAGVSKRTLTRIEHGASTQTSNLIRVLRALDMLENLEALIPEPALSPMQQLKLKGKTRQRATAKEDSITAQKPWSWETEP